MGSTIALCVNRIVPYLFEAAEKLIEAAMNHEDTKHLAADLKTGVRLVNKINGEVDEVLVCRECAGEPCTVTGLNKTLFEAAKATAKLLLSMEICKRDMKLLTELANVPSNLTRAGEKIYGWERRFTGW